MMDIPKVTECGVDSCSYNHEHDCHAVAITIGSFLPTCDTYADITGKGGLNEVEAGVGACKHFNCQHNENLVCGAPSINVDKKDGRILCLTFKSR